MADDTSQLSLARVVTVDRDRYTIRGDQGESPAELTGKLLYASDQSSELPCVGDWVRVQYHDAGDFAIIHKVEPRKTFLRRKSAGKNIEYQMIASNIDVAFIVQSCHFDFNIRRLERYLVMVKDGHIEPILLLTKMDLLNSEDLQNLIANIKSAGIEIRIIPLSNVTGNGLELVQEFLEPEKTYCLLGSSGVGKTTLINRLQGNDELETKTVSDTGEGRHTTVRRQIIELENGAFLVDTPGMRELGILSSSEGLEGGFSDIQEILNNCRFADCTHNNEPGCAVLSALESGDLDKGHYQNYLKLKKESDFHEMSFIEKKKKDKALGRHIKSVMKHKKDK